MMVTIGFFLIGVEDILYRLWLSNMAATLQSLIS